MDFNNTQIAFQNKTNADLKRNYWLFKIISWNWLIKLSRVLLRVLMPLRFPIPIIKATIFKQFCGGESIEDCNPIIKELASYKVKTILDYSVEGEKNEEAFDANVKETIKTIEKAASEENIPFSVFKMTAFASFKLLEKIHSKEKLDKKELEELNRAKIRINKLCEASFNNNIPIFIDAEESWIQDAIDEIALEMMQKYNKENAIVFNTIQLYRWDRLAYLKELKAIAEQKNFILGIKLVRGAYLEKERNRAKEHNYKDPIQKTKENTDKDFNLALEFCIENSNQISFCCASHNEESALLLIKLMERHNINKNNDQIYFAQLLGMSDHISMNLAKAAYNVAKYVPYGPVKEVTPYLIRRAEENTSIAGQTGRELTLILEELKRRKASN